MHKLLLPIGIGVFFACGLSLAQPRSATLAFEVATVKPSAPLDPAALRSGTAHIGTRIDASRVDIGTASLFRLICNAYRLRPYQVSAPEWVKSTMFDIQAKIPDGVSADKVPEMLQTLLVERFGLKIHNDSKDQPVYALIVAKSGPKMQESAPEPPPPPPAPGTPKPMEMSMPTLQGDVKLMRSAQGISIEMPGGEISGKLRLIPPAGPGNGQPLKIHVESSGTTMRSLAEMLSVGVVDRPVVDATGLTGSYEVAVDINEDEAMNVARSAVSFLGVMGGGGGGGDAGRGPGAGPASVPDPAGSSIFKSIENLGLKLEARKMPLELLVVDHIEKMPSEN